MNDEVKEFARAFARIRDEYDKICFLTTDQKILERSLVNIRRINNQCLGLKEKAITNRDEYSANLLLSIECLSQAMMKEIEMLILLKKNDPNEAWLRLIDAEELSRDSIQAMEIQELRQEDLINKLLRFEKTVFPPQLFLSASMITKNEVCSLCHKSYDECDHIEGKAYTGKFCGRIGEIQDVHHVAFVSRPYDKRARVMSMIQNGIEKDVMSLRMSRSTI